MKLKFIENGKINRSSVLIGKTGAIRFKIELAKELGFVNDKRVMVGTDLDESPTKHVYFIMKGMDDKEGFKLCFQNKSWFISGKTLIRDLKLNPPLKCKVELWKDGNYEGFKIILP